MVDDIAKSHIVLNDLPLKDDREPLSLKEKQILQVHILEKLKEGGYLLFFKGQTVVAQSTLSLQKGQTILAKVESLTPRLVLNFLDNKRTVDLNSRDMVIKKELTKLNVIPDKKNMAAANAFIREQIPLKSESFTKFLQELKDLNLTEKGDIDIASKMKKLSLPLKETIFKEIKAVFQNEDAKVIPLKELTQNIKTYIKQIDHLPEAGELRKVVTHLDKAAEEIVINQDADAKKIVDNMTNSISFSGKAYEKVLLQKLSAALWAKSDVSVPVKELISLLDKTESNINSQRDSLSIKESHPLMLQKNIQALKGSLESILDQISSKDGNRFSPLQKIDSTLVSSKTLLKFIHNADSFLRNKQELFSEKLISRPSDIPLEKDRLNLIEEKLTKLIRSKLFMFDEKQNAEIPKNSLIKESNSFLSKNINTPNFPVKNEFRQNILNNKELDMSSNIKEELFKARDILQKISVLNTSETVEKDISDKINEIVREQLNSLNEDSTKFNSFNLLYQHEDSIKELELFFKKQSSKGKSGKAVDQFSIFFSMELSNLGYFEINLLDMENSLNVTFFSKVPEVRSLFAQNKIELETKLKDVSSKNISLKTALPAVKDTVKINKEKESLDEVPTHVIDIMS